MVCILARTKEGLKSKYGELTVVLHYKRAVDWSFPAVCVCVHTTCTRHMYMYMYCKRARCVWFRKVPGFHANVPEKRQRALIGGQGEG